MRKRTAQPEKLAAQETMLHTHTATQKIIEEHIEASNEDTSQTNLFTSSAAIFMLSIAASLRQYAAGQYHSNLLTWSFDIVTGLAGGYGLSQLQQQLDLDTKQTIVIGASFFTGYIAASWGNSINSNTSYPYPESGNTLS